MNGYNSYDEGPPPFLEGFQFWASNLPTPVYVVLAVIGGAAGFIYGLQQPAHHPQYLYAIYGTLGGASVIPLLAMLIRFLIQCVLVALLLLAVYYAFFKP